MGLIRGESRDKLPHRPLELCSNLPNDHGYLMQYSLNSRPNFGKQKCLCHNKSPCVSAYINSNVYYIIVSKKSLVLPQLSGFA